MHFNISDPNNQYHLEHYYMHDQFHLTISLNVVILMSIASRRPRDGTPSDQSETTEMSAAVKQTVDGGAALSTTGDAADSSTAANVPTDASATSASILDSSELSNYVYSLAEYDPRDPPLYDQIQQASDCLTEAMLHQSIFGHRSSVRRLQTMYYVRAQQLQTLATLRPRHRTKNKSTNTERLL